MTTIVFIHGAWVTPSCWDPMKAWFEAQGYDCIAPAWPGKDRPIEEIRRDPSPLKGLGIAELVAHHEAIVRGLPEPPILIGHSFGGLFTQLLLDRGLGAAGVAIDPAPPRGVPSFEPTAYRSLASVLLTPGGWGKVVRWTPERFGYAFVHTLPPERQRALFEEHVVPETGRIFFQDAFSLPFPGSPARLDFKKADRAPLLMIAGEADRIVPAALVRRTFGKYGGPALTELRAFPGRTHWLIADEGWEEIAASITAWLADRGLAPAAG